MKRIDEKSCEYTNHIHSTAIDQTLAFLKEHNISLGKRPHRASTGVARAQPGRNAEIREKH